MEDQDEDALREEYEREMTKPLKKQVEDQEQ